MTQNSDNFAFADSRAATADLEPHFALPPMGDGCPLPTTKRPSVAILRDRNSRHSQYAIQRGMSHAHMIPLGYMLKTVAAPAPEWMNSPQVVAVHSLSGCVSENFGDYINLWQHNGWWLFDTAEAAWHAADCLGLSPGAFSLFYYEGFPWQFVEETGSWEPIEPESSLSTHVIQPDPRTKKLSGYDVVTFSQGTAPECSPLSCNGLAASLPANGQGLFDSFDLTHAAVENGDFRDSEPGPYRIVAVYSVALSRQKSEAHRKTAG